MITSLMMRELLINDERIADLMRKSTKEEKKIIRFLLSNLSLFLSVSMRYSLILCRYIGRSLRNGEREREQEIREQSQKHREERRINKFVAGKSIECSMIITCRRELV